MVTVNNGSKSMVKGERFTHGPIWRSRGALSYVPILTEQREVPGYSHGPFYPSEANRGGIPDFRVGRIKSWSPTFSNFGSLRGISDL